MTIKKNLTFGSHWHKEIELIYCISGKVSFVIEKEPVEIHPGQLAIINSSEDHSIETDQSGENLFLVFEGGDALLGDRFKALTANYFTRRVLDLQGENEGIPEEGIRKLRYTVERIVEERQDPERKKTEESYWYLLGYCYEFFATLLRFVPMAERTSEQILKRVQYFNIIQPVISFVESSYFEPISVERAAKLVNYERTSFCRIFHSITGTTFLEYLNGQRVEAAKNELVKDEMSIGDIGKSVGIPNAKSFTRIFRQYTGMLPTEYKKAFSKKKKRASEKSAER